MTEYRPLDSTLQNIIQCFPLDPAARTKELIQSFRKYLNHIPAIQLEKFPNLFTQKLNDMSIDIMLLILLYSFGSKLPSKYNEETFQKLLAILSPELGQKKDTIIVPPTITEFSSTTSVEEIILDRFNDEAFPFDYLKSQILLCIMDQVPDLPQSGAITKTRFNYAYNHDDPHWILGADGTWTWCKPNYTRPEYLKREPQLYYTITALCEEKNDGYSIVTLDYLKTLDVLEKLDIYQQTPFRTEPVEGPITMGDFVKKTFTGLIPQMSSLIASSIEEQARNISREISTLKPQTQTQTQTQNSVLVKVAQLPPFIPWDLQHDLIGEPFQRENARKIPSTRGRKIFAFKILAKNEPKDQEEKREEKREDIIVDLDPNHVTSELLMNRFRDLSNDGVFYKTNPKPANFSANAFLYQMNKEGTYTEFPESPTQFLGDLDPTFYRVDINNQDFQLLQNKVFGYIKLSEFYVHATPANKEEYTGIKTKTLDVFRKHVGFDENLFDFGYLEPVYVLQKDPNNNRTASPK